MDTSKNRREETNAASEDTTRTKSINAAIKRTKEKPTLSPIEEETESRDSSGDNAVNYHDIGNVSTTKKYSYDRTVGLSNDYEQVVVRDLVEETTMDKRMKKKKKKKKKRRDESPPFLTARNTSDRDDSKYCCDSSATTSNERNTDEDEDEQEMQEEEEEEEDDSSLGGESTSGDVDYRYEEDYDIDDVDALANDDLEIVNGEAEEETDIFLLSSRHNRKIANHRPKSAPSCSFLDSSDASHDDKFGEITNTLDWLKARIVKSEKDIFDLKKQLRVEKIKARKLTRRYEDDRNVTRESLRIDLELWIKKLNDGLKEYLAEWQKRERLRLNEEISRISDLYSQEIAKSLKISMKDWQMEETKNMYQVIERREKSREDSERFNGKVTYEKIQTHLENLEKRNRKSYATLCKQIDKWEDRLRDEIVKLHEEDLKKLRQHVNTWYEDERKKNEESSVISQRSKERCTEMKRSGSFLGAEALLQVEENLLKRLRDGSAKDLRRTEQIVRTELKTQRRELAKRMNDKIAELWMAFEEFGCTTSYPERRGSRLRTELVDECRGGATIIGNRSKDVTTKNEVSAGAGRWIGGKITRSKFPDRSSLSKSDEMDEDDDRDYGEDDDENETTGESSERNMNKAQGMTTFSSTLPESSSLTSKKLSFTNQSTVPGEK